MMWDIPGVEDLEHLRFLMIRPTYPGGWRSVETVGFLSCLSAQERTRFHRFRNPRRATEFLVGRSCARVALGRVLDLRPADVPIRLGALGRPLVGGSDGPSVSMGISHSGGEVLVGLSLFGSIGIDIQRGPRDPLPLANRFFDPAAAEWIARQPRARHGAAFASLWSVKEAVAKSIGVGPWSVHPFATYPPGQRGTWESIAWQRIAHPSGAAAVALSHPAGAPHDGVTVDATATGHP